MLLLKGSAGYGAPPATLRHISSPGGEKKLATAFPYNGERANAACHPALYYNPARPAL
ncbi:protein of unknown function [Agrobacterium pusense]|uniref:Uncharacterized protein n=1 Tax=Agrobacterium pusense TaxID=648995 RepID=U4Q1G4_9HYPH|nr:protein of unknown function [Agrobacterium pusense]